MLLLTTSAWLCLKSTRNLGTTFLAHTCGKLALVVGARLAVWQVDSELGRKRAACRQTPATWAVIRGAHANSVSPPFRPPQPSQ